MRRGTAGQHQALKRLHKRNLPISLHADLQAKFSSWMVRNVHCSILNRSLSVFLMPFLVAGSCHASCIQNRLIPYQSQQHVQQWQRFLLLHAIVACSCAERS
jgi:hypothetical protein